MTRSGLPVKLAMSEAKEMLGPGTNATSLTLAHILWALAHDIGFQEDLALDLRAAGWPTDMFELERILRLKAAVKEGIRWAGAATAILPRIIPKEGAVLAGIFVPSGVSSPNIPSLKKVISC